MEVKTERNYYVQYYHPGVFVSETSTEKVSTLNPADLKIPKSVYAFQFWSVEGNEINGKWRSFDETKKVESGMYYIGQSHSLEQIKMMFPDKTILHDNIESNSDIRCGVKCRFGNWQAFNKDDKLWEIEE